MNILDQIKTAVALVELKSIRKHDALLVLEDKRTGRRRLIWGRNIVTTAGNTWYAQKACGQTPTNAFTSLYLATAGPSTPAVGDDYDDFTVQSGSEKAVTSGYPKVPDTDSDNTGLGATVVSWKFEYATSDGPFATAITHSFISIASATTGSPILNSYKWSSSWTKDVSTSAKVFANHTVLGS